MWGKSEAKRALDVAQRAAEQSASTDARVTAHEARCTERWNEARETWARVERAVESLQASTGAQALAISTATATAAASRGAWQKPAITALTTVNGILLTVVGALALYILNHGHG